MQDLAAILIDFENVYYYLRSNVVAEGADETDLVVQVVGKVKKFVLERYGETVVRQDAYADFDRIREGAQSKLYRAGVETHNVLGTEMKNAADMKLCIDALDLLYNRPEIRTFVFLSGDRDYIPVIRYLQSRGKSVRVVGFQNSTSAHLVEAVGVGRFIQGSDFLGKKTTAQKKTAAARTAGAPGKPMAEAPRALFTSPPPPAEEQPE